MEAIFGYIACLVAVLCFGSNFIPVKKYSTGNGLFFQFAMCCAILFMGILVNLYQINFDDKTGPHFYPLAMLGGVLWCTGNILCVQIINRIGMGVGLLVWGTTGMITGWFCGTFGFFGMKTDNERLAPQGKYIDFSLNIPGVVMAMVSLTISLFIKPEVAVIPPPEEETEDPSGFKYAKFSSKPGSNDIKFIQVQSGDATEEQNTAAIKAKFEGFIMAIVAGVFFGVNFNPCIIVQDTQAGASQEGMDYVFSHFSGVFVASTVYFLSYCAYQMYHGLKPDINPLIAFPGWLSGFMWAIAQTSWFIALTALPVAVCFPLISIGPGLVGSLWGVFAFGEITGTRNYLLLVGVFLSITVAATLIVMSQKPIH